MLSLQIEWFKMVGLDHGGDAKNDAKPIIIPLRCQPFAHASAAHMMHAPNAYQTLTPDFYGFHGTGSYWLSRQVGDPTSKSLPSPQIA